MDEPFEPSESELPTGTCDEPFGEDVQPLAGRKAWFLLSSILVIIAVAVLYVYQAGDRKTILGNQPIPAGQLLPVPPLGQSSPFSGGLLPPAGVHPAPNAPTGGFLNVAMNAGAAASPNLVQCPQGHGTGLPLCSACGSVMRPLSGSPLFACPSCGSVGVPMCPRCGAQMTSAQKAVEAAPGGAVHANMAAAGGQFQCPACGATGLPNWDQSGIPHCPSCGTQMRVR